MRIIDVIKDVNLLLKEIKDILNDYDTSHGI
jgi:hypothetical protein